jgi:hypothetical protein
MTQTQLYALGAWVEPNCIYCGKPIAATSDSKCAPQFLNRPGWWAHHRCYFDKGKGKPTEAQAALFTDELKEEA